MKLTKEEFKLLKRLEMLEKKNKLSPTEVEQLKSLREKKADQSADKDLRFKPGNDFSWWNKEPALMADAANIKSKYIAGKAIAGEAIPFVVPGILRVKLCSTYGAEDSVTDPINVWARDFYLKFFQKYRGAGDFSASDLAITIFAENEIVKLIAKYERIYGVINRYSRLNINIPHTEVRALGITQDTAEYLRNHLSDFRYDLNVLIRKAQRLCIPKDLSSIADAISLFGYEYMDHDSVRSQIIVFDLERYMYYDEELLTTGGALVSEYLGGLNLFVEDGSSNMCRYLDKALNQLLRSDSVQKILANMVVWFGEAAMLEFKPVPEEYVIVPVKDDTMLHKLHNIDVISTDGYEVHNVVPSGMASADKDVLYVSSYCVFQFNDVVHTKLTVTNTTGDTEYLGSDDGNDYFVGSADVESIITKYTPHILDTYRVEADPEVIVEGSLFKYAATHLVVDAEYTCRLDSLALYMCQGFELITATKVDANFKYINKSVSDDVDEVYSTAGYLTVVDWAPLMYWLDANSHILAVAGDIDNPVVLYDNDIMRLQQTVLYSAFKSDMQVLKG